MWGSDQSGQGHDLIVFARNWPSLHRGYITNILFQQRVQTNATRYTLKVSDCHRWILRSRLVCELNHDWPWASPIVLHIS